MANIARTIAFGTKLFLTENQEGVFIRIGRKTAVLSKDEVGELKGFLIGEELPMGIGPAPTVVQSKPLKIKVPLEERIASAEKLNRSGPEMLGLDCKPLPLKAV